MTTTHSNSIVNCVSIDNDTNTDDLSLRSAASTNRHTTNGVGATGAVELPADFLPADIVTEAQTVLSLLSTTLTSGIYFGEEYEEEEEEEISPTFSCSPNEPSELGLYTSAVIAAAAVGGAVTSDAVDKAEPTNTNSAPENTVPDSLRVAPGQPVAVNGLSISDVDGSGQYRSVLSVDHGSISVGAGGQISNNDSSSVTIEGNLDQLNQSLADVTYVPQADFIGNDTLTVLTEDSSAVEILSDTDTVGIQVTDNQAAQIGGDQRGDVSEDGSALASGALTATDSDDPDNSFTTQSNTAGLYGSFSLADDGTWNYSLDNDNADVDALSSNDSLTDNFTVASIDGTTAVVSITINGANDAPMAVDDSLLGDEDTALTTANVLANDSDPDTVLSAANISDFSQATNGSVINNGDGTFGYTPTLNFSGDDSFTYTLDDGVGGVVSGSVNITVAAQNDAPRNSLPDAITANENIALSISGLSVSDVDAGTNVVSVSLSVQNGIIAVDDNAAVTNNGSASLNIVSDLATVNTLLASLIYTPGDDFVGDDSLSITTSDNGSSGAGGNLDDTDVLAITVLANQAATIAGELSGVAVEDSPTSVAGTLTANDPDDTDNLFQAQVSSAGTFGIFDLLSNGNWNYALDNANASVNTLNVNDSTVDSFSVTSIDGTTATVTITINGANDAPDAVDDSSLGDEDTILSTANVLANDSDPDNILAANNISSFTQASDGMVVNNGDGTFSYTPGLNFNGADSFTYTVDDGAAPTVTATVTLMVNPVNDAPENSLPAAFNGVQSQDLDLLGITVADIDVGLASITVTLSVGNGLLKLLGDTVLVTGNQSNTLTIEGDTASVNDALSTLVYTPNAGFIGTDGLLVVTDDGGATGAGGAMSDSDSVVITVSPLQPVVIFGEDVADLSGYSVSNVGDVNGDGSDDILIGAPDANGNRGLAYVVYGRDALPDNFPLTGLPAAGGNDGFVVTGSGIDALAGFSVSGAGDVNGDGFADLLVGAPGFDGALPAPSNSYLIYGGQGLDADIDVSTFALPGGDNGVVLLGANLADGAGHSVSVVGDINGDGYADMLVAAPDDNANTGAGYLVFGSASLINQFPLQSLPAGDGSLGFQVTGLGIDSLLGWSVSAAGDVNGDGLDDMILGAPGADDAYVIFGSDQGFPGFMGTFNVGSLDGINGFALQGGLTVDLDGVSVAGAGDFNGDGLDDLIIGASQENGGAGASFVVYGSATPSASLALDTLPVGDGSTGFVINGIAAGDHSGHAVTSAGDFNGDGIDDILIGANSSVNGQAYLIFGGQATGAQFDLSSLVGSDGSTGFVIDAVPETSIQSRSVSAAGDINGDGFDDLLIGAPGESGDIGATVVLYGASDSAGNPIRGNNEDDIVTGTAADEQLVGGAGNDILDGTTGSDVLIGGNGDDTLIYDSADDLRVDGGNGHDTLQLKSGDSLDLRLISDALLSNIEVIDAETDAAANNLGMNLADVLSMSDTTNDLFIIGTDSDTVSLELNFSQVLMGEVVDGRSYDVYSVIDTDAMLYIEQDVVVILGAP